ncbi:MAG: Ku protein [Dehalococcoidia bacterium]
MPRAIWKGTISFGMVSIPVRLFTATESKDISFRQLHADDFSPIRLVRWCPVDDRALENDEIVKGYEYAKDRYVIITDEDFEKLPVASKHTIELNAFVDAAEIDPSYYEKTYYLEPEEIAEKPYALLVRALADKNLVAVGKIAIRQKERLCALRVRDGLLILETLYYADEIRKPDAGPPSVEVSDAELKMAHALIDMLREPFDPAKYRDEYREALLELIRARVEGEEVAAPEAPAAAKPAVDLMAALKASVEAARQRKGEAEPAEEEAPSANGRSGSRKKKSAAGSR